MGGGFLLILLLISTLALTVIFSTKRCPICCVVYLLLGNKIPQNLVSYCSRFPGCQFGWGSAKQVYCRSHLRSFIRVPSHLIDCLRWIHRSGSWCWLSLSTHSLILKETSPDFFTQNSQAEERPTPMHKNFLNQPMSCVLMSHEPKQVSCPSPCLKRVAIILQPLRKGAEKFHSTGHTQRERRNL